MVALVLFAGAIVGLTLWIAGLIGYLVPQEQEQIRQAQAKIVLERLVSLVDAQTEQLERLATSAANRPAWATHSFAVCPRSNASP